MAGPNLNQRTTMFRMAARHREGHEYVKVRKQTADALVRMGYAEEDWFYEYTPREGMSICLTEEGWGFVGSIENG